MPNRAINHILNLLVPQCINKLRRLYTRPDLTNAKHHRSRIVPPFLQPRLTLHNLVAKKHIPMFWLWHPIRDNAH